MENTDQPSQIRVTDVDGVAIVCFNDLNRCAYENESVCQLNQELLAVADQGEWLSVILDFESKEFLLTAIIEHALIRLHQRLSGNLQMCNLPQLATERFRLNQLAMLFHIYETREEALAAAMKRE